MDAGDELAGFVELFDVDSDDELDEDEPFVLVPEEVEDDELPFDFEDELFSEPPLRA